MKFRSLRFGPFLTLLLTGWSLPASEPAPPLAPAVAEEATQTVPVKPSGESPEPGHPAPAPSAKAEETTPVPSPETGPRETKPKPPLNPENSNLNLPKDLELKTLDTGEMVFLPAGTYRQIRRIPIDSPTMDSVRKVRTERRPEIKVERPAGIPEEESQPLWIRYESLEKIKINGEERRGGIDLPFRGPENLSLRLWYAKSETADTASSVFYFLFGGLGYSAANIAGWSAGNVRAIPADFEYRLIRR